MQFGAFERSRRGFYTISCQIIITVLYMTSFLVIGGGFLYSTVFILVCLQYFWRLGPPIPTTFGNTGISVLEKTNTGIPVLIPVFRSISVKAALGQNQPAMHRSEVVWVAGHA